MNTIQKKPRSEQQKIYGIIKIGSGTKYHPGVKYEDGCFFFQCSCPNTQNGWALHRSKFYSSTQYPNLIQNCGN